MPIWWLKHVHVTVWIQFQSRSDLVKWKEKPTEISCYITAVQMKPDSSESKYK